ncbi:nucleotide exchange factor GrpE [Parablautia intestinalis]|uniref:Protein GrpE n=1 Tax=Parablautia intestinalis TaxID=2320100 RepID=A0A3A9ATK8_9FIRM|nr:nucleotide exchange factor GrpE [Parablautia intestinalis]MCI8615764.1 nucleotide exchange factor GrpE [Lachnospiraceae bacterium]MDE7048708.1 nucleotide exchange factor GrpE [Lachnospiraceae bacterium]RKI90883.1 nucleotide exchange factor GrpE [Parablautia intestinalis]
MSEEMKKNTVDNPGTEEVTPEMKDAAAQTEEITENPEDMSKDIAEDAQGTDETDNEEQTASGTEEDEKEGRPDKKAKRKFRDKKQDALKEKVEELEDRVKRQMAEFENFRKRTEKEKTAMFETGAKSVIEKILPVVDNFERGLAAIPEGDKGSPFAEGMEMIYKQLITELEKMDVKPIPAVGEEFNPDFHNAVMQVESGEYESGIIAQELQKGYTYRDSVVRHSMVAVVG